MPACDVPFPKPTELQLRPFRAVRYDADRVGDPSGLLAPPFDDLDPARTRELRHHPHHVARLLYADVRKAPPANWGAGCGAASSAETSGPPCTSTSNSVAPESSNAA
jgi:hypothetical protein